MSNKKLFVGGYYDDRIFNSDVFEGKTPFDKDIDTYTLDEAFELGFCEEYNVRQYYEDHLLEEYNEKDWSFDLSDEEKTKILLEYTDTDEIAGLLYFNTEEEAENYKQEVLKEIEEIESQCEYSHKEQDEYGYYREVYTLKA